MKCPGCAATMMPLALEGHLGTTIDIDVCAACRTIWFDRFEELRLTPQATLKVFGVISESADRPAAPLPTALHCPRCNARLLLTHDIQRNTRFQYWRCDGGHGRLITFIDFLREKDFVRPLTPQQIVELRQNIQAINCSNCGAAINLLTDSVCPHCGSALSILDLPQMARMAGKLAPDATGTPDRPAAARDPSEIEALVRAFKAADRAQSRPGLIETGLGLLSKLLE